MARRPSPAPDSRASTVYWIEMRFALAAAFFGSVNSSTPSAYLALAPASSTG